MNPGSLILYAAVATALAAGAGYAPTLRGRPALPFARLAFLAHAGLLLAAMGLLAWHFIAHHFEYVYVSEYSSRALAPAMALAASWAGQEGSILLWACFGGLIGAALLFQPGPLTRPAMSVVSLMQLALLWLVMIRDPFRTQVAPPDGQGLNPLLNDPWMVAHPPFLFLGYAALVVPFALALAAIALGAYKDWNRAVWPWSLFAALTLGVGIALGGVWAYTVLGWGGYWGWDPVENASLIPWLVSIALLHGLMIQRANGALVRTNLSLSAVSWLTVLGGTYLTRSGILSDFSVHSFSDSGLNGPLTTILGVTFVLAVLPLALKWRGIESPAAAWTTPNRASALWLGLVTVVLLAVLVAVGTTAPLLTMLAGKPANVQASYYKQIIIPLGLAILFLMAVAPALRWSRQERRSWMSTIAPGAAVGLAVLVWGFASGIRETGPLALAASAGLAIGINLWMMVSLFRRGWRYGSGYLGHFGVAVMALGMLVSAVLGKTERLRIREGETVNALGRQVTYAGLEPAPMGGAQMKLTVAGKDGSFEARPRLLPAMNGEGMIHTPAISVWREVYVSPLELQETPADAHAEGAAPHGGDEAGIVWLAKGEATKLGDATVTLQQFRMEGGDHMKMYADLAVTSGGKTSTVSPFVVAGAEGMQGMPVEAPGLGTIVIAHVDADHGRVAIHAPGAAAAGAAVDASATRLTPPAAERFAVIELSTKPLINLVWVGAILTLVGTAMAGLRRAKQDDLAARATRTIASGAAS